jgi:hypothetical protein
MSPPAFADAGGGAPVILADTGILPSAAAQWRGLLDTSLPAPQQIPEYGDPASEAAAAAMANWPFIHEARTNQRNAAADQFVGATNNASQILAASDQSGADGISGAAPSSSAGPTLA